MNRIDPQTLYTTAELRELLAGHVSIPTLRRFGLKGLSGGYFGANVLSALETYTRDRLVPGPAPRKGAGNAIIGNELGFDYAFGEGEEASSRFR